MEASATSRPVVEAVGLGKRFGSTVALDGLDLEVAPGEVMGLLGPNGAGKSTTLGLVLGLLRPSAGVARVFGLDARRDAERIHRRLAYVPSGARLWPGLTGDEVLDLLGSVHGGVDASRRAELVARFELDGSKKVRAMSDGTRQKVLLVAALATDAELLLLDEPTGGLDPIMDGVFRACVREARARGQTVLLSSHQLGEVEALCDRVAMLREGRLLVVGALDEVRRSRSVHVEAVLSGPAPALDGLEGVRGASVEGRRLRCDVIGPIEPVLRALCAAGVEHVTIRERSLEEVFLSRYGGEGREPARAHA